MGGIKRLTVAVVVNHKQVVDAQGKVSSRPLTDDEKNQISELAKQAMGFSEERGDSLSVVNSSFMPEIAETFPEVPLWKDPNNIDMAKDWLKNGLVLLVLFILYRRFLRPLLRKLSPEEEKKDKLAREEEEDQDAIVSISGAGADGSSVDGDGDARAPSERGYKRNLESARQMAKENPKMVASIVTSWVNGNE